jgi:hypothetical protein
MKQNSKSHALLFVSRLYFLSKASTSGSLQLSLISESIQIASFPLTFASARLAQLSEDLSNELKF